MTPQEIAKEFDEKFYKTNFKGLPSLKKLLKMTGHKNPEDQSDNPFLRGIHEPQKDFWLSHIQTMIEEMKKEVDNLKNPNYIVCHFNTHIDRGEVQSMLNRYLEI